LTVAFLIKEIIQLYQKYKNQPQDFMQNIKKIFVKSRVCKACNVNLSSILNKECMHMNLCDKCYEKSSKGCMECNKKMKNIVEMHVC